MPGKSDFDRGLNDRGNSDLPKIAHAMSGKNYLPQYIYTSSSNRTLMTIQGIVAQISSYDPQIIETDKLYAGSLDNYLDIVKSHTGPETSLMLVGHNPTCDALAAYICAEGEDDAMAAISCKFPTGAMAVIDLEMPAWTGLSQDTGYLRDFILPRKLPD